MFQDKSLLAVAEAVKKVWVEELIGNQKKIDKNHNGKIDGQDFKILKGEKKKIEEMTPAKEGQVAAGGGTPADKGALAAKYKKEVVKEEDAYSKDRYAVKDGKAMKDNPTHKGSPDYADKPHHVWATSPEEAMKNKKTVKEEAKKPVSPFDWKNTPKQTGEKGELSGHTSKKISTGTVYTKKYVKEEYNQKKKRKWKMIIIVWIKIHLFIQKN